MRLAKQSAILTRNMSKFSLTAELFAEFLGTMVILLFGNGVVAMVVLFGHGAQGEIVNGGYTNITWPGASV